jgi:protein ImuB
VPALPLQLLLRGGGDGAAAVVDKNKPTGVITFANEGARRLGVLPGMRYAAALSLAPDLHAREVPPAAVAAGVDEVATILRRFSPGVEPAPVDVEPGVFWLDVAGLARLYASADAWAREVRAALAAAGFRAAVVVGFTRFGTYALARSLGGARAVAFARPADETAAARRVPLSRVGIEPRARDDFAKLGVATVGELVALPAPGIARRFGAAARRLHQLAAGKLDEPLTPMAPPEPLVRRIDLDDPEADVDSLTFRGKQLLDPLLPLLARRGEALAELEVRLGLRKEVRTEIIRPAEPTLDGVQVLGLLRLRLESLALPEGARSIEVEARGQPATTEQLRLWAQVPRRDVRAAGRALARVRAAFGDDAVVTARLRDGHLPEARFAWEPLATLAPPSPRPAESRPLVRRIVDKPAPLPPRPPNEPDGWLLRGVEHGSVARLVGPHLLSGGWWRLEVARDYYFAEMRGGEIFWIYYDRRRRRWFLQGEVA